MLIEYSDNLFIEYPEIMEAYLIKNKSVESGTELITWTYDNILSFEIFDIKIYVLPMSRDMSTWENINEALKNPLTNISFNKNVCVGHTDKVELRIDASFTDDFITIINEIKPNILKVNKDDAYMMYD